ncbi:bud emergence protein 1 [Vermiconidia calcicola]|uniref:Bud emergence protein 1 n=1 Tax=Vermiconidia calcicola TaxID=1690605 RepID=A0ACC3MWW1_9PEZI|nr:bud emergence protein 1 [Vermiconidia calcicola]
MKFRRSVKSEKHDSAKPVQISIPQKDAIAIEPPKKVIKALYDYSAPAEPPIYLSFSAGDFLHVVSREDDTEWYEACNPLRNERGLVPVTYFDTVGKTIRDSGDSISSISKTHDSGYAERSTPPSHISTARTSAPSGENMPGHRMSRSVGRNAGGVYGVVSYDFNAERPDELDAKEGEAIIVIAQSNPEWFVAKPITRLGGPGLIPVSFIEIRDMTTGQAVPDPIEAVRKAGIPRVEEWKKMAAEYKNTSIPLGTVSSSQQVQNIQQGMDRMSVSSGQTNGYGHERRPSAYTYQQQQQQNLYAPLRASVPRYIYADEKFHFVVECKLSNGTHWDLSRIYEDFFQLQMNLINAFPEEAGTVPGKPRILPYMPGPVQFVTDNISEGRRMNLDEYLRDLLRLQQHITCSSIVRNFFAPRQGDYEVDLSAGDLDGHARPMHTQPQNRYSAASQATQGEYQNGGYHQQQQQRQPPNNAAHQYNASQPPNGYGQQQSYASNDQGQQGLYRSPSGYSSAPRQQSQAPQTALAPPVSQNSNPSATSVASGNSSGAQVKVKAWFDRDTCVVIRMPPRGQFGYEQLYQKIVERRRLEYKGQDQTDGDLEIEYRDEKDGEYYRLEGDDDLDIAVERNEKLTLAVRAASEE